MRTPTDIEKEMKEIRRKIYFENDDRVIMKLRDEYNHLKFQRYANLVNLPKVVK